jgi:hypothetical protein
VVLRQELSSEQAETAKPKLQNLPIQQLFAVVQRQRAWEIGIDLDWTHATRNMADYS